MQYKGLSRAFSKSINSLVLSFLYSPTLTSIHDYWKNHSFKLMDLVGKMMSLHFNTLSRFFIAFLPRSKCLLISWLQSPSAMISETKKVSHCFHSLPMYLPRSDGTGCHDLRFLNVEFSASFFILVFHHYQEAFQLLFTFCR